MTYSLDFRWQVMSLIHVYNIDVPFLSEFFGPKPRTICQWYALFDKYGVVDYIRTGPDQRKSRWPPAVLAQVERYCKEHPTFYLEELKDFLESKFPDLKNVSLPTICRALNHDLKLTRKVLTKATREAAPEEVRNYKKKLEEIYSYPTQLVFLAETSKDGSYAYRL